MLLILTNSQDTTADYLTPFLTDSGVTFFRLNTDFLVSNSTVAYRPGMPYFKISNTVLYSNQIRHIWYRRPEQLKDERFNSTPEGKFALNEWSEAIEGFLSHIPQQKWMNHPSANASASQKIEQLSVAQSLGFSIPDTLMTQDATEARVFYERHNRLVVAKPMSNGYVERDGKADSLIYTNRIEEHDLNSFEHLHHCPTLFQQYIKKSSDVRITVVDKTIHAIELKAMDSSGHQRCDIRRNNMSDVEYTEVELPNSIKELVLRFTNHYRLRFAAIDMVVDLDCNWHFLEVNPNGQWAWLDIEGKSNIASSFVKSFSDE